MPQYAYEDLPQRSGLFRLLTIQAASDPEQTIYCSLNVQALEKTPQYNALSYVWGDQTLKVSIKLNDSDFEISVNLQQALKCIRQKGKPVVMWIDAICINQNSIADRNVQVRMMGNIYRSAQSVIVWLGTDPVTGQLAADMTHLWAHKKFDPIPLTGSFSDEFNGAAWTALVQVLRSPWWSRMWTYQEYVLAREVVFMFGTTSVQDFVLFAASLAWSNQHDDKEKDELSLEQIRLLQDGLNEMRYLRLAKERFGRLKRPNEPVGDLLVLQDTTHERDSQDPRDKIYALLGSTEAVDTILDVDYSRSVEDVYLGFAQITVQIRQDLYILQYTGLSDTPASILSLDLPSWVPDFRASATRTLKLPLGQITDAGGTAGNTQFSISGRVLTCAGIAIDEVSNVTHAVLDDSFDVDISKASDEEGMSLPSYLTNTTLMHSVFKTLRLDCYGAGHTKTESMGWQQTLEHAIAWTWLVGPAFRATFSQKPTSVNQQISIVERTSFADPYAQQFRLWMARILMKLLPSNGNCSVEKPQYPIELLTSIDNLNLTEDQPLFYVRLLLPYIRARLRNRALFGTKLGFFGNGPALTQSGDILSVLFGCPVPMILRPTSDGTYQVVGRCFVADLMQGEAVETWRATGAPYRTFNLS